MKDAIQSPRRNLYTLKMPHGVVLIKQDHESAHVTFKGQNFHGGSCFRIVPWDSVESKELPQDAQLWEEKGCSPAHLTLGLQAAPSAPQGLPQLLEGFQDTMALSVPLLPDSCLAKTCAAPLSRYSETTSQRKGTSKFLPLPPACIQTRLFRG